MSLRSRIPGSWNEMEVFLLVLLLLCKFWSALCSVSSFCRGWLFFQKTLNFRQVFFWGAGCAVYDLITWFTIYYFNYSCICPFPSYPRVAGPMEQIEESTIETPLIFLECLSTRGRAGYFGSPCILSRYFRSICLFYQQIEYKLYCKCITDMLSQNLIDEHPAYCVEQQLGPACSLCLGRVPRPRVFCQCPHNYLHEECLKTDISNQLKYRGIAVYMCDACLYEVPYQLRRQQRCRRGSELTQFFVQSILPWVFVMAVLTMGLAINERCLSGLEVTGFWMQVLKIYLVLVGIYLEFVFFFVIWMIYEGFVKELLVWDYEQKNESKNSKKQQESRKLIKMGLIFIILLSLMINYFLNEHEAMTESKRKIIHKKFLKRRKYNPFHLDCDITKQLLCYCKKNPICHMSHAQKVELWRNSYLKPHEFYSEASEAGAKKIGAKGREHDEESKKLRQQSSQREIREAQRDLGICIQKIRALSKQEVVNFVKEHSKKYRRAIIETTDAPQQMSQF